MASSFMTKVRHFRMHQTWRRYLSTGIQCYHLIFQTSLNRYAHSDKPLAEPRSRGLLDYRNFTRPLII